MNKFEQVSCDKHQMPLARENPSLMSQRGRRWRGVLKSHGGRGVLYSEVQCIMGDGHIRTPGRTDRHYLPSTSLAGGKDVAFAVSRRYPKTSCFRPTDGWTVSSPTSAYANMCCTEYTQFL